MKANITYFRFDTLKPEVSDVGLFLFSFFKVTCQLTRLKVKFKFRGQIVKNSIFKFKSLF